MLDAPHNQHRPPPPPPRQQHSPAAVARGSGTLQLRRRCFHAAPAWRACNTQQLRHGPTPRHATLASREAARSIGEAAAWTDLPLWPRWRRSQLQAQLGARPPAHTRPALVRAEVRELTVRVAEVCIICMGDSSGGCTQSATQRDGERKPASSAASSCTQSQRLGGQCDGAQDKPLGRPVSSATLRVISIIQQSILAQDIVGITDLMVTTFLFQPSLEQQLHRHVRHFPDPSTRRARVRPRNLSNCYLYLEKHFTRRQHWQLFRLRHHRRRRHRMVVHRRCAVRIPASDRALWRRRQRRQRQQRWLHRTCNTPSGQIRAEYATEPFAARSRPTCCCCCCCCCCRGVCRGAPGRTQQDCSRPTLPASRRRPGLRLELRAELPARAGLRTARC
jgi:hypothetical protein